MTDRLSSFHEAGHATVSYMLGELPERVSIRTEGNSLGHVAYLQVEAEAIARAAVLGKRDVDRVTVMRNLVATAAGPVAQAKATGGVHRSFPFPWTMHGGMGDHAQATRLMTAAGDLLHTSLDDLVDEAADLLEARWDAVERVAGELRRYKEIGFKELQFAVLGFGDERAKPGWTASETRAGQRVISKAEAERTIKAQSPFGWKRIGWDREMERR